MRILTFPDLKNLKGIFYSRRYLRDLCEAGKFPQPVPISAARIGWVEEEVDQWLAEKIAQRGTDAAPSRDRVGVAARKPARRRAECSPAGIVTSPKPPPTPPPRH